MSISQTIYVGCYLRVYMPKETVKSMTGKCPKCGRLTSHHYCPLDGGEVVFGNTERMIGFYEWCEEKLGDGDMFSTADTEDAPDLDYKIVLANKSNQSGHARIDKLETELPTDDWAGDWITLAAQLERDRIKYERKFGVVSYWS